MTTYSTLPTQCIANVNTSMTYDNTLLYGINSNLQFQLYNSTNLLVNSNTTNLIKFTNPINNADTTTKQIINITSYNNNLYYFDVYGSNSNNIIIYKLNYYTGVQTSYIFTTAPVINTFVNSKNLIVDNQERVWISFQNSGNLGIFILDNSGQYYLNNAFYYIQGLNYNSQTNIIYNITNEIYSFNVSSLVLNSTTNSFTFTPNAKFTGILGGIVLTSVFNNDYTMFYFIDTTEKNFYKTQINGNTIGLTTLINTFTNYCFGICNIDNYIYITDSSLTLYIYDGLSGLQLINYSIPAPNINSNMFITTSLYNGYIAFFYGYTANLSGIYNNIINLFPLNITFNNLKINSAGSYNLSIKNAGNTLYTIPNFQVFQTNQLPNSAINTNPEPIQLLAPSIINIDYNLYGTPDQFELINNLNNIISTQFSITPDGNIQFTNVIIPYGGNNELFLYDVSTGSIITSFYVNTTIICFKEGTKILCLTSKKKDEYIAIEDIKKNMFVRVYSNKTFQYKKVKYIVKSQLYNSNTETINKLYKLSASKDPRLIEDLYITGSHSLLYDKLTAKELINMTKLKVVYNDMQGENFDIKLDNKFKLIAYYNERFEPFDEEGLFNIYHIVLENDGDKNKSYGIYANGVLAESTTEASIKRFPNYELLKNLYINDTTFKLTDKILKNKQRLKLMTFIKTNKNKSIISQSKTQKFR